MQIQNPPADFINLISPLFPNKKELYEFIEVLKNPPKKAIRFNEKKTFPEKIQKKYYSNLIPSKIDGHTFLLADPKNFKASQDPFFLAGYCYLQEPAGTIIKNLIPNIPGIRILDFCASPGGKTTCLLDKIPDDGLVVANEVVTSRIKSLTENLVKWGNINYIITQNQARDFQQLEEFFDVILIDAPCSGEGLSRKQSFYWSNWSLEIVESCKKRQLEILNQVHHCLKPGGILIYSTCTYNQLENEKVISDFLNSNPEYRLKSNLLQVSKCSKKYPSKTFRFLPHLHDTEGFSLTILKKINSTHKSSKKSNQILKKPKIPPKKNLKPLSKPELKEVLKYFDFKVEDLIFQKSGNQVVCFPIKIQSDLEKFENLNFRVHQFGLKCGYFNHKQEFIPSLEMALSNLPLNKNKILNFTNHQVIKMIKNKNLSLENLNINPKDNAKFFIGLDGLIIGLGKATGKRLNTYFFASSFRK